MDKDFLHISPEGHPAKNRIGNIWNKKDRARALNIVEKGGTIQMIIGDGQAGVGGIFFNIDDPTAINHVVRIKSTSEKNRQALFAIMTPDEYLKEVAAMDLTLIEDLLELAIFWRVPVKDISIFPEVALTPEIKHIQAFPSDRVPFFSDLVREAMKRGFRLGGTSLNYTGTGNLTEMKDIEEFFLKDREVEHFWLNTKAKLTGTSYTIVQVVEPSTRKLALFRTGNVEFKDINI